VTELADLLAIAQQAAEIARHLFQTRTPGILTAKGDRDYASEVDYTIERTLRRYLAEKTPTIGFLGEEDGKSGSASNMHWALDPVDGTVNFAHALPLCGVSLGLVEDNRPILGVIDLPFLSTRYTAMKGCGSLRNGEPIHVSNTAHLHDALVTIGDYAVGTSADDRNVARLAITSQLARSVLRIRMFGSFALDLAWLADGKTDALVTMANKPWDTAAGVIIAREAGAVVVDLDGSDHDVNSGSTIAANPVLVDEVLEIVRDATSVTKK
jgi:myo-inositol-1(or 4)-monophosphatase